MADVQTYDPSSIVMIVGGITVSGYADGTFLVIDEMTEGVMSQAGADGEVARAMSTDRRTKVTITLQQTSLSNILLAGLYVADRVSGGSGVVPLLIEDLSGTPLLNAGQSWIDKLPSRGYGKQIETRGWVITAVPATLAGLFGGNS